MNATSSAHISNQRRRSHNKMFLIIDTTAKANDTTDILQTFR